MSAFGFKNVYGKEKIIINVTYERSLPQPPQKYVRDNLFLILLQKNYFL